MITELIEKNLTRKLYEETFDDPKEFIDYYYKEKCSDNRIIVSIEDGEVISMLHLNPYYVNMCGTVVRSYYVVAVATAEDKRHTGQMTKLFKKAFKSLKDEHIPFVFLLPVDESIYSWMGFEKICDFAADRETDYEDIKKKYDVYCVRDADYIRRMEMEEKFRQQDEGEMIPDKPVIMAKVTDLKAFSKAAGICFHNEKEALEWLRKEKIYFCEEV